MKFKNFSKLFILFFVSLIFSSCGEIPDCSIQNTDYKIYEYDENRDGCVLVKQITKNTPTNGIIETGENFCTAPSDVPEDHPTLGCTGGIGEYLKYQCQNKKCILDKTDEVKDIIKELKIKKAGDVEFLVKLTIPTPYIFTNYEESNLNFEHKSSISVEFFDRIQETNSNVIVQNVLFERITITNSNKNVLAQVDFDKNFNNLREEVSQEFFLKETDEYESEEKLYLEAVVSYTRIILDNKGEVTKSQNIIETLPRTYIDKYTIINPKYHNG